MDEFLFSVNITTESVSPDRLFKLMEELGAPLQGYVESMCQISTRVPLPVLRELKKHPDVMRVRITTTAFQFRMMLRAKYEEHE